MQNVLGSEAITFNASTSPAFLTLAETAERWRVCRQTIGNLIAQGDLKSMRIGRRQLIPASEIERFEHSFSA